MRNLFYENLEKNSDGTYEKEIRNSVITEFAERMKDANKTNAFVLYQSDEIDLEEFISLAVDEIASQMKGEKEC